MNVVVSLQEIECFKCHTIFAMTRELYEQKLANKGQWTAKGIFFCPQGHDQYFTGESDLKRTQRLLEQERQRAERNWQSVLSAERRAAAARGQVTRIKNRVHAGVCTDCKRSFTNLRRHMATKHPDAA